tara:strand:+ start:135 stop:269 length:135 start_codon:yes stop_codon:yes gene_type:complete
MDIQELDEIEDYVYWNLSFGIPIIESLKEIKQEHLIELFSPIII